ncbi:MAG TPA: hypothetical protein VG457_05280, partial [Planctomycetota bacterium]|nr:hypothetical protein [Planctomycetota bacterium]
MPTLLLLALALGDTVVEAGQTLALTEDLLLSGGDSLDVRGTPEARCRLSGNGHSIRTADRWTGRIRITSCDIHGLGAPQHPAIETRAAGHSELLLEACLFEESSSISIRTDEASTARIATCTLLENSTVVVDKAREKSFPIVVARGSSTAAKVFQGNRVYKSHLDIEAPNWLIGGDIDAQSNLLIGWRSGVFATGTGTVVRRNYIHVLMPRTADFPWWSQ